MERIGETYAAVLRGALLLLTGALPLVVTAAVIDVTPTNSPTLLTDALFGGATGTTVSNRILIGDGSIDGPQQGTFLFPSGTIGIGIPAGLILTTGAARGADPVVNSTSGYGNQLFTAGDADLDGLISPETTNDANVLSFVFTPTAADGNLIFRYVFATEERSTGLSPFPDVFGLYVDGAVPAQARADSPSGFIANSLFEIGYDDYTSDLVATVPVRLNQQYAVKLAIADGTDNDIDSAVFISARFERSLPAPEPSSLAMIGLGAAALGAVTRRKRTTRASQ